jgi:hypothetical protein
MIPASASCRRSSRCSPARSCSLQVRGLGQRFHRCHRVLCIGPPHVRLRAIAVRERGVFPQYILGYLGMPRRYYAYPPEFQVLNVLSSWGHDPCRRLPAAAVLPHQLDLPRRPRAGQPMGQPGPGVADTIAAVQQELCRHTNRDGRV